MSDKEQFGVSMQQQLDEWKKSLEESEAEAEAKGASFMDRVRPDLDKVYGWYGEAKLKLRLLQMDSEDAAGDVKAGLNKAMNELKSAWDKARSHF